MLINLNVTAEQLAVEAREEIELLFSELLRASAKGSHLIIIDRNVCDWAKTHLGCNGREKAQLDRLKETFTQRGSLPSMARSFLEITAGDIQLSENSPHKYRIGHRPFLKGNYLEPARLLVEHMENDGDLLWIILNEIRLKHPIRAFEFERQHGGGSDITSCLRIEIPRQSIVVTVVDSDKFAPCDKFNATKQSLDVEAARQTFTGMVCETPCKEAENYIPLEILKNHKQKICPQYNSFKELESLFSKQTVDDCSDCFWLFFDIKKGIEVDKLSAITIPEVQSWVQKKYQINDGQFNDLDINGFGDGILRQFLNCGEAIKDFTTFMNTAYWQMHFEAFFDLIYWYFVSEKKVRVL